MTVEVVHAHRERQRLLAKVIAAAPDLRGQLRALRQAAHRGADAADIKAVQAVLFSTNEELAAAAS